MQQFLHTYTLKTTIFTSFKALLHLIFLNKQTKPIHPLSSSPALKIRQSRSWLCQSLRKLSTELHQRSQRAAHTKILPLLRAKTTFVLRGQRLLERWRGPLKRPGEEPGTYNIFFTLLRVFKCVCMSFLRFFCGFVV